MKVGSTQSVAGRGVRLAAALLGLTVVSSLPALAQTAAEIQNTARQVAGDAAAQKNAGKFDAAAQQRAVERLGKLVLGFIDLSDRATNTGAEGREREPLRLAYQAVSAPLEQIYDHNSRALERMAKQVMDEDGDLEALYETRPFKDAQLVASQALYFLNWLHYYGARLYEGDKRKQLLEAAQRGFSEFAVGDRHTELLVESLLGRGLCHLELGNMEFAVHDLQSVANDPKASPERKSKARLALLDGYVRAGNTADALKLSDQMLGAGGRSEENVVRFLRIRALLAAAKTAAGAEAERYRQQALALMDRLRRAGAGWEEKVAALAQTGIENPEKWADSAANPFAKWEVAKLLVQKGDYKQAAPLLEGFVTSTDAEMRRHQGEARYFLGLAQFQAGQYEEAAQNLDAALQEEKPPYGADAAYLRFKAREAVLARDPAAQIGPQYEQAVRDYLTRYPDHRSAFEARFRLGELLQAQGRFADAIQAYANVQGDPGFELRARFATLQCHFEQLQAADGRATEAQHKALVGEIGTELQRFDQQAGAYEKRKGQPEVGLSPMRAKVAVMKAVYAQLAATGDSDQAMVDALAGFEEQYPDAKDLLPQVVRLRLGALQRLGRFADAEVQVKVHGPSLLASFGTRAIEELAVGFVREGARRNGRGDAAANQAAQQVALRLYEQLVSESEGAGKAKLTLARLYENTGERQKAQALYTEVLQSDATSLAALRGLGRIAESEKRLPDALGYWAQVTKAVRPGDVPWYEGGYEIARLTQAMGNRQESCAQLEQLKPAMPGLSDADLRKKLDGLYQRVCQ